MKRTWKERGGLALRWIILSLSACAYIPTESSPYDDATEKFQINATTRAEVFDELGVPNVDQDEFRYMLYVWEADGIYVAPLIAACMASPVGKTEGPTHDFLTLEFDENGDLTRIEYLRVRDWDSPYTGGRTAFLNRVLATWANGTSLEKAL